MPEFLLPVLPERPQSELLMKQGAEQIHGYSYGSSQVPRSPVSLEELENLKVTVGFTEEDQRYLQMAGKVLADQASRIVDYWRGGIIAGIPNLARHARTPEGSALPGYLAATNLRFQQWILDTCLRPYDQAWLDYQQEIALRHTSVKKNKVDEVRSTSHVPLRDIIAIVPVMNETILPYLAAKGHSAEDVDKMHRAWCKSLQLQLALWTKSYMEIMATRKEW